MSALLQLYLDQFLIFVLVLTRISGLVMTAPIWGARNIPMQIRALLAVGMSLIITPVYWAMPVPYPGNLINLAVMLGREALLGVALGVMVMILFAGLQLAGQVVGQMSGMSLADVFDPAFDANVPVFAHLLDLVTLAVFVATGGHRQLMRALLDSFQAMPPGQGGLPAGIVDGLVEVLAQSFVAGVRAAAPVMVALMLSILILGLVSRTLPQLNIMAVGFGLNTSVMLIMLVLSIGTITWIFQQQVDIVIERARESLVENVRL